MRTLFIFALALFSLATSSCDTTCPPEPSPACYSGVVVGYACMDGLLIEVDAATPIGKPAGFGDNVVAAVNFEDFAGLDQPGQRVYFTYHTEPARQAPSHACPQNTIPLPVPHVVVSNLSSTACPINKGA